jgi:hypothetical protein
VSVHPPTVKLPLADNRVGDPGGAGGDRARILDRYPVHG